MQKNRISKVTYLLPVAEDRVKPEGFEMPNYDKDTFDKRHPRFVFRRPSIGFSIKILETKPSGNKIEDAKIEISLLLELLESFEGEMSLYNGCSQPENVKEALLNLEPEDFNKLSTAVFSSSNPSDKEQTSFLDGSN
jgi:hypothetical protein